MKIKPFFFAINMKTAQLLEAPGGFTSEVENEIIALCQADAYEQCNNPKVEVEITYSNDIETDITVRSIEDRTNLGEYRIFKCVQRRK